MNKHKHLSENDRYAIMHGLNEKKSFKGIGKEIERDCTTIAKEVRTRRTFKQTGCFGSVFNDCKHRAECTENNLCDAPPCRNKACKRCTKAPCRRLCKSYEKEICQIREQPPYVCNGCDRKNKCSLEKALYVARGAHLEYKSVISESRSGVCADEGEIRRLDSLISPLLMNGQSIHHILANSPGKVMWSEKTIYKYVDMGLLKAGNLDLRRKVRFRPRKSKHESLKVDRSCHIGRNYDDYKDYVSESPGVRTVQMDTVHGKVGGKCLLTLHFVIAHFMLAFILDACTSDAVNGIFANLRNALGTDLYKSLFQLLLGDRGSEFSNPMPIEFDEAGDRVSRVFYCDPQQSQQKGALERNHEFIRYVIPKGKPMDTFFQQDISLMMDHINSYGREDLNNRTPYHLFEFLYGNDALKKLGVNLISPEKILLRPSLLKR